MHSEEIVQFFDETFNEKNCSELCRKSKFIRRSTSKLKGSEFIKAMIVPSKGLSTDSLKGLCKRIKTFNNEADLSAQALCKRINHPFSNTLMKGVLAQLLLKVHERITWSCPKLLKRLGGFNRILIEDSSIAVLNEKLEEKYTGTNRGGCSGKAQVKIDLIHDLAKGTLVDAALFRGNEPDRSNAERIINFIQEGDLIIRDLGYFTINGFNRIVEAGAYFLSRLLSGVNFYLDEEDKNPLDIGEYIKENHRHQNLIEMKGFLGNDKVPIRLIIYRNPKNVINKRLREANMIAKSKGTKMSASKKLSLHFSMFITNASEEMISAEVLGTVYRLRWEIELVFKRWKHQLEIDYLKGINSARIDFLIWSRLCMIMLVELVTGYFRKIVVKLFKLELSEVKLIQYLIRNGGFFSAVERDRLSIFFEEMIEDIPRMLLKDKRQRRTMREKIYQMESYYEMQNAEYQQIT